MKLREGSLTAITYCHLLCSLDPASLARGQLGSLQTRARLSARQLARVAQLLEAEDTRLRPGLGRHYVLAVEWLEAAEAAAVREQEEVVLGRVRAALDRNCP